MTMRDFIKRNRRDIDEAIQRRIQITADMRWSDEDRRQWVLNDEGLYNWARSEGVRI